MEDTDTAAAAVASSGAGDSDVEVVVESGSAASSAGGASPAVASSTMFSDAEVAAFREAVLSWYSLHRRRMPWRGDAPPYSTDAAADAAAVAAVSTAADGADIVAALSTNAAAAAGTLSADGSAIQPVPVPRSAYGVWVSEIMLQQTRVEAVLNYWSRWMTALPTVTALAAATEEQVNTLWAGLGFYRRARNLHKGAQAVADAAGPHAGAMPRTVTGLLTVPGIGPYTAGAIGSIAYDLPVPLVDGNVIRVLSRCRAIAQDAKSPALNKLCWKIAAPLVNPGGAAPADTPAPALRAAEVNQALMEIGATVCTPRSPNCKACPLQAAGVCTGFKQAAAAVRNGSAAAAASPADIEDCSGGPAKKRKVQTTLSFARKPAADAAASSSAASASAASPAVHTGAATGLSPAQWTLVSSYIEDHYPLKPVKKDVPTEVVHCCVVEIGSGAHTRYFMVKSGNGSATDASAAASASSSAGGNGPAAKSKGKAKKESKSSMISKVGAVLEGQWQPPSVAEPLPSMPKRRKTAGAADGEDEEGDNDAEAVDDAEAEDDDDEGGAGGAAASASASASASAAASASASPISGRKRGRELQGAASTSTGIATSSTASTTATKLFPTLGWALSASEATNTTPYVQLRTLAVHRETTTHVFSHIHHQLYASRCQVVCEPAEEEAVAAALVAATVRAGGGALQAEWVPLRGLIAKGLTTWSCKVLHLAIGNQAPGKDADAESLAAWAELQARWKKAGCK